MFQQRPISHAIIALFLILASLIYAAYISKKNERPVLIPPPLTAHCETAATRCRLPGGALGVCLYDEENNLFCMPQH